MYAAGRLVTVVITAGLLYVGIDGIAQSLIGRATKIQVTNESSTLTPGSVARLKIELLDPKNGPAKADKDFVIEVSGLSREGGRSGVISVVIKGGESSKIIDLPVREPGLFKLSFSNKELIGGGAILNVRSALSLERAVLPVEEAATPTPSISLTPEPSSSAWPSSQMPKQPSSTMIEHRVMRETPLSHSLKTLQHAAPAAENAVGPDTHIASPAAPSPSSYAAENLDPTIPNSTLLPATWSPSVTFLSYPDRKFAANKKDAATIYAMLSADETAPWDMAFNFRSQIGIGTVIIRKGEDHGETQLVSDQPGFVDVTFLSSKPWPREILGVPLKLHFAPPVTALAVRVNPPSVDLFESAEVTVELRNADNLSILTEDDWPVSVAVEAGSGGLDLTQMRIPAKNYFTSTRFRPVWPGSVQIVASSLGLREVHTVVNVLRPTLILVLCGIGGLAGGLVAFWSERARWPRIVIGLITGFVLYWLLVFGLVHIPGFPNGVVFNPFSAAIIALLGGWGGTKTITFALQRLGIKW